MTELPPPEVLRDVIYPSMRAELAGHLRFLQQLERSPPSSDSEPHFRCAIDFIFNDTKLSSDPAATMGWFLKSVAEIEAFCRLTEALDKIVPARSDRMLKDAMRDGASWAHALQLASAALDEMETSDSAGR